MANADVAEGVDHAFVRENAIGGDEIIENGFERHAREHRPSRAGREVLA